MITQTMAAALGGEPGSGRGEQSSGWLCRRADCDFAIKRRLNWPQNQTCWSCCRPKSQAMNPPAYARVQDKQVGGQSGAAGGTSPGDASAKLEQQRKKREARTRKREARRTAKPADGAPLNPTAETEKVQPRVNGLGPVAMAMAQSTAEQPARRTTKLVLPKDLLDVAPLLHPAAIKAIIESLAQETMPAVPDDRSTEAIMAKYIGDRGPTAKVARRAELEASIGRHQSALASLGESDTEARKCLQARVDTDTAELEKLNKAAPSQCHERLAVAEAKSSFERATQARKDREQNGAAKAAERQAFRAQQIADLESQLALLKAGLREVEAQHVKGHEDRKVAAEAMGAKVSALCCPNCRRRVPRRRAEQRQLLPAPPAPVRRMPRWWRCARSAPRSSATTPGWPR